MRFNTMLEQLRALCRNPTLRWFAVGKQLAVNHALAVAYHPNTVVILAVDHRAGAETLLRMSLKVLDI